MRRILLGLAAGVFAGCAATRPSPTEVQAPSPLEVTAYAPMGSACGGLERSDELVCRSELRISRAREAGDASTLACFVRRSSELRATYRFASATRDDAHATGDEATLARARLASAEKEMERQYAALDECARAKGASPDTLRVSAPTLPEG